MMSFELLSKMAYARNEEIYLQIYNELSQCAPKGVLMKIGIAFIISRLMD